MNTKRIAAVSAILAVIVALVPMVGSTSDAADDNPLDGQVVVSTSDGSNEIELSLDSGSSSTVYIYVINKSESHLGIKVTVSDIEDVSSSYTITVDGVESHMINPASSADSSVAMIALTLATDTYADNAVRTGTVNIHITDLEESSYYLDFDKDITVTVSSVFTSGDSYNKFFGIFPNTLGDPLDEPWITAIVTLILWLLATVVLSEIIIPAIMHLLRNRTTKDERKKITRQLTTSITAIMFMVALNECAQIVGAGVEICSMIQSLSALVYVLLGAEMAWQLYVFIVTIFMKTAVERSPRDGMDMSLLPLLKMLGKLVICVVAALAICTAFGVDLAGILVSAGVVTLGITLGAQSTLNQFFSGIVILATRPFIKGDFIQMNGTTYIVRKVRVMNTEFSNWDNDQVIVMPNSTVADATIVNLTKGNAMTRIFVYVDVAYDSDVEKVKATLESVGMSHPHVIKDGSVSPPNVRLTNFNGSGMEFRLACFVDDYDSSGTYAGQIRELIIQAFRERDIEIPYDRIEVDVLSGLDASDTPDKKESPA